MEKSKFKKFLKEYGMSIMLSFTTGFLIVIVQEPTVWNIQSIKDGSFLGLFLVAIRTGLKGVADLLIYISNSFKKE